MPIENKDVIIGDNEYSITTFTTSKGLTYLKQLSRIIAPSFAAMTEASDVSNMDVKEALENQSIPTDNLSKAINLLVENMDKEDVVALIKNLVGSCRKGTKDINFDIDFAGNYKELAQLVMEVVNFNYSSVFQGGVSGFNAGQK